MKEKATKLIKVCRENATPIIVSAAWLAAGVTLEVIRNKKKTRKFYSEQLDYIEQEALWSSENPEEHAKVTDAWNKYEEVCDKNDLRYFLFAPPGHKK